jgi:hypothetical protein
MHDGSTVGQTLCPVRHNPHWRKNLHFCKEVLQISEAWLSALDPGCASEGCHTALTRVSDSDSIYRSKLQEAQAQDGGRHD